jgi:hypothetical protein
MTSFVATRWKHVVTLSAAVLAFTLAACNGAYEPENEPLGVQGEALVLPPISTVRPPISLPPLSAPGCADGTAEQSFASGIVGCAGSVTFPNRASLCAPGYHVLSGMVWRTSRGSIVPTHHYWTNDALNYNGTGTARCWASYPGIGNACPANQPMRVCARTNIDPEGNRCNWFDCSMDSGTTTPNDYMGGCAGNATAGTLCVPDIGCADGTVEQTFTRGMVGCAGSVTFANAAQLCTAGYTLAYDSDWLRYRLSGVPTHNYWVATPPTHFTGNASTCVATYSAADPSCPADTPMRVCVSGGTDPEGNRCNWSNCDVASGYSTAANEYFGGCFGNTTAGALCVPNKMCADGTMEQQWSRFYIGCGGSVSWGNRESLCGPRQLVINANNWLNLKNLQLPTHNYWVNDHLLYSGTSGMCSVSTTTGTSCGMDDAAHVCTASGTDAEGNTCSLTHCGLNSPSPDLYFGGCGATAGVICVTGP